MMQVIPKWKVTVTFGAGTGSREFVLWVSDGHIANVLRTVANLQFTATGLEQPTGIYVILEAS